MKSEFQFLPNLSDEEYRALKSDIAKRGVQVPIEFDEQGNILDGHHRLKACQELGIKDYPSIIRVGMSEEEKFEHVLALNLDRRHLNREQRDELILTLRKRGYSIRQIAEMLGVGNATVIRICSGVPNGTPEPEHFVDSGSINIEPEFPERVIGKDGKNYPARRPAIIAKNQHDAKETLDIMAKIPDNLKEHVYESEIANNITQLSTLAKMEPEQQRKAIELVESGEAKNIITARKLMQREAAKDIEPPSGKYQVIYADPPWEYDFGFDIHGAAQRHYNTMGIDELCALPIKELADDNAVLFLWVTSPKLADCFRVIEAWGFVYKTSFVWDKIKHVMGHYNSVRHEFLLICTRGSYPKQSNTLRDSVVSIERSDEHSEKPEAFREIIEEMYPYGKKIELFARKKSDGWDVWGAEV